MVAATSPTQADAAEAAAKSRPKNRHALPPSISGCYQDQERTREAMNSVGRSAVDEHVLGYQQRQVRYQVQASVRSCSPIHLEQYSWPRPWGRKRSRTAPGDVDVENGDVQFADVVPDQSRTCRNGSIFSRPRWFSRTWPGKTSPVGSTVAVQDAPVATRRRSTLTSSIVSFGQSVAGGFRRASSVFQRGRQDSVFDGTAPCGELPLLNPEKCEPRCESACSGEEDTLLAPTETPSPVPSNPLERCPGSGGVQAPARAIRPAKSAPAERPLSQRYHSGPFASEYEAVDYVEQNGHSVPKTSGCSTIPNLQPSRSEAAWWCARPQHYADEDGTPPMSKDWLAEDQRMVQHNLDRLQDALKAKQRNGELSESYLNQYFASCQGNQDTASEEDKAAISGIFRARSLRKQQYRDEWGAAIREQERQRQKRMMEELGVQQSLREVPQAIAESSETFSWMESVHGEVLESGTNPDSDGLSELAMDLSSGEWENSRRQSGSRRWRCVLM